MIPFFVYPFRRRADSFLAGSLLVLSAAACGRVEAPKPKAAVPVRVAAVTLDTVPVQLRVVGTVEAISSVSLKAQISGPIAAINFREGQEVRKGELLFRIDPRPYEVELQRAQAALARDRAAAAYARTQAERYTILYKQGVATTQEAEQMQTNSQTADAVVKADEAAVAAARLNLSYCSITSPMNGRTGALKLHLGDLTKANDVPILLVINQIAPIYASFAVPEQHLDEIRKYQATGELRVEATITGDSLTTETGQVSFINNTVDDRTGTVMLKATFVNADRRLWPGQFVDVVLTLTVKPGAVVAPTAAVQTGQNGQYVYVVKPDRTVESRDVTGSLAYRGMTVIEQGLAAGEMVVIDGQMRLAPGTTVQVKDGDDSGAPAAGPMKTAPAAPTKIKEDSGAATPAR